MTTGKDRSFSGVVKNMWVLDAAGRFFSPVGEQTSKSDAFLANALHYGMDFTQRPQGGERWIAQQVFSGELQFPLLWAKFGQNKWRSIQGLRLSHSYSAIVRNLQGQMCWHDGEALRLATTLPMRDERMNRWWFRGLPEEIIEREAFVRDLQMPRSVLSLSDEDRFLLRQILGLEKKSKGKKS